MVNAPEVQKIAPNSQLRTPNFPNLLKLRLSY
jgi:hypothetical protein